MYSIKHKTTGSITHTHNVLIDLNPDLIITESNSFLDGIEPGNDTA